jgi:lysophospholipase L1-like esterase
MTVRHLAASLTLSACALATAADSTAPAAATSSTAPAATAPVATAPATAAAAAAPTGPVPGPTPGQVSLALKPGDHVAIIGDSITEQKIYTRFIADYLWASSGVADLDVAQFGWSGETAPGFLAHLDRSLDWYKPTAVTLLYGMNDGRYTTFTPDIGKVYGDAMGKILDGLKTLGATTVVVSTPGAVDTTTFKRPTPAAVYNDNLAALGGIGKSLADARGLRFADTHEAMIDAMARAKAAFGQNYAVCGNDGVHPDNDGHLVMMASFLENLGCDGAIATITIGADGKATASAGHTIAPGDALITDKGIDIDSTRWPFVLGGDGKSTNSTRAMAPFIDFTARLDRFTVVMPECAWAKAKITWGTASVTVDGAQLKSGVNLMDLFTVTPFDKAEAGLDQAVGRLQAFETNLVKVLMNSPMRSDIESDPQSKTILGQLIDRQVAVRADKVTAIKALLVPVHYHLTVAEAK